MNSLLATAHPFIAQYGYGALFGVLFAESFGLPLPGEAFLVTASFLATQGQLNIWLVGLTAWTAAVLGDNVGYAIGRFGGRRLVIRHGARVGISAERLNRTERFFAHYGPEVVIAARFSRCCVNSTASLRAAPAWAGTLCNLQRAGRTALGRRMEFRRVLFRRSDQSMVAALSPDRILAGWRTGADPARRCRVLGNFETDVYPPLKTKTSTKPLPAPGGSVVQYDRLAAISRGTRLSSATIILLATFRTLLPASRITILDYL